MKFGYKINAQVKSSQKALTTHIGVVDVVFVAIRAGQTGQVRVHALECGKGKLGHFRSMLLIACSLAIPIKLSFLNKNKKSEKMHNYYS